MEYFDTSYKGWKPDLACMYGRIVSISILPIRDGNKGRRFQNGIERLISILPIRDGNWLTESVARKFIPNFDTSYKGWKHADEDSYISSLIHFDTSYKGWKHRSRVEPCAICKISILPIRDGNVVLILSHRGALQISILPIRDGNLRFRSQISTEGNISILPIRDGNMASVPTSQNAPRISILPIRDGNLEQIMKIRDSWKFRYFL